MVETLVHPGHIRNRFSVAEKALAQEADDATTYRLNLEKAERNLIALGVSPRGKRGIWKIYPAQPVTPESIRDAMQGPRSQSKNR